MERTLAGDPVLGLPATAAGLARRGLVPLAVAMVWLAAYLVSVVGPYLGQDLSAAGAPGVALLTLTIGPPVVLAGGAWALAALVSRREVLDRAALAVLVPAVAASVLLLALMFSPAGLAMAAWTLD